MKHAINLRPFSENDITVVWEWRNSHNVSKYMYRQSIVPYEEHEKWFHKISNDNSSEYWIIQSGKNDIGVACITNINVEHKHADWAFYIANTQTRNSGIGAYVEFQIIYTVFEKLKLNKLCCEVLAWNESVIKLHKKFGFVEEGIKREHVLINDEYQDIVCFSLLASEWEKDKSEHFSRFKRLGFFTSQPI
ncbi:MAG: UDP-4-amino-4,6-dideoxy-N-acetyl-beta-L-altrosamine N-acetyltransferase [Enterobacterales bacterium]|jgi:UDP-4-amino-4,6-dideoxy-N-acetyl-beta-L-altrosamine N-acetyltransferase